MKTFQFRLTRILHIRMAQERSEQQKLDQLTAGRVRIENEITALDDSLRGAQQAVRGAASVRASELTQLQSYERGTQRLREQIVRRLAEHDQLVSAQAEAVITARRNVKLLEKLRDKKHGEWQAEAERELETLSSEFATAQWIRLNSPYRT